MKPENPNCYQDSPGDANSQPGLRITVWGIDITRHKHSISPEASSRSAFHKRRRKSAACRGTGDRHMPGYWGQADQTWEGSQWREQQTGLWGASARLGTEGPCASLHDRGEAGPSIKPAISSHSSVIRSWGCTEQGTWDLLNFQSPQISDDKRISNDRALKLFLVLTMQMKKPKLLLTWPRSQS